MTMIRTTNLTVLFSVLFEGVVFCFVMIVTLLCLFSCVISCSIFFLISVFIVSARRSRASTDGVGDDRSRSRSPKSRTSTSTARRSPVRRFDATDVNAVALGPPPPKKPRGAGTSTKKHTSAAHAVFLSAASTKGPTHLGFKCRVCNYVMNVSF